MFGTDFIQRPTPCEFCENPAKYQCQNCDDPLCKVCKEKHEKKKPHHKYVPYSQKTLSVCKKHTEHKYVYWCEACKEACCTKCVVTSHKGHDMIDIEDAIRGKIDDLTKTFAGPFQKCLKEWETLRQEARKIVNAFTIEIEKLDNDLLEQAAQIHAKVDETLLKVRNELQEISKTIRTELESQEHEINKKYEECQGEISKFQDLREKSGIDLLECNFEFKDIVELPTLSRYSPPNYSHGQINEGNILSMIGNIKHTMQDLKRDKSNSAIHAKTIVELPSRAPPTSTASLLTSRVLVSVKIGYDPVLVCASYSSGGVFALVKTGDRQLQKISLGGYKEYTIQTGFEFNDVAVTSHDRILLTDNINRCIVSGSRSQEQIGMWDFWRESTMSMRPGGICVLRDGGFVVTDSRTGSHAVTKYNRTWNIVHNFDGSVFSCPRKVAVNKVNDDLYVCDPIEQTLFAFTKDNSLRFRYKGFDDGLFDIQDVSCDTSGRVFIADMDNHKIHILDMDGNFIQYLQCPGLTKPCCIDVDNEGNAWILELKGRIKILKYQ